MEPDAVEIRVLGCLIEKQRTTPDVYPLTLNSLRLACNQSTNREPVVDYDESTIRAALDRLIARKWATLASWANRRTMKYRQTLDRELGLDQAEMALLGVLMLRGPQTPGELRTRTERLYRFESAEELSETLARLTERELVACIGRRPGQREDRWVQLLGGGGAEEAGAGTQAQAAPAAPLVEPASSHQPDSAPPSDVAEPAVASEPGVGDRTSAPQPDLGGRAVAGVEAPTAAPQPDAGGRVAALQPDLENRIAALEQEVADLKASLQALRDELGA